MTPEKMISKILEPGFEGDGALSNDLLSQFYRGFPIENLRPLLTSQSEVVLSTAAFIAVELGWPVHPFVSEIVGLLDHPKPRTRFDAIETLWRCTTRDDSWALGRALLCLEDPHHFVRGRVMTFIRVAVTWQLILALKHAAQERPKSVYCEFRRLFPGNVIAPSAETIRTLIEHSNPVARRFGVGLAGRPRLVVDEAFLDIAETSDDQEVSERAAEFRVRILPISAILSSSLTGATSHAPPVSTA